MPEWTQPDEMRKAKVLIASAREMEDRHRLEGLSDVEKMTCHAVSHAAFLYSVAHAEAWANQLIHSAKIGLYYMWGTDDRGRNIEPPTEAQNALVELSEKGNWRPDAIARWNSILAAFDKPPIDTGSGRGQDFKLCIKIRNQLIHPTPQLFAPHGHTVALGSEDALAKTTQAVLGKRDNISLSPLFDENHPFLPMQFLSASACEWAARTSDRIVLDAFRSIGAVID